MKKEIGKRIQESRKEAGLSQEQLAEAIDVSYATITSIEQGKNAPSIENFVRIANELKVSADLLLADVLDYGYKVKASRLGEMVESLPTNKQEQVFDVVAALIKK